MRVLGVSELGRRAQKVIRDDARCEDMLAIETDGELHIHRCVTSHDEPEWAGHYSPWAKIVPDAQSRDLYHLEHISLAGRWRVLDVQGTFEFCVRQILENRYHLFFG